MKGNYGHDLNGEREAVQRVYRWLREAADEDPGETQYDALWNARAVSMLVERVEAQRDELLEALRQCIRMVGDTPDRVGAAAIAKATGEEGA